MDRKILHIDMNSFYASVELLTRPDLANKPVVVGGDETQRHGIVLAKNDLAKGFGIKTAETLYQARQKAPNLVVLPPHHDLYHEYSLKAKAIYKEYTDRVQSFGPDEAWLDLTNRSEEALALAEEIRARVKLELGLTVSIGISWNKTFAKMGSDYKKPDAITVISRANYKDLLWPKPVGDFLFVGSSTATKLKSIGIATIRDLALADPDVMANLLGKNGRALVLAARGEDDAPVLTEEEQGPAKSIGSMTTTSKDLSDEVEIRRVLTALAEEVAERLAEAGMRARTIRLNVKDRDFVSKSRQRSHPTGITEATEIAAEAIALYHEHFAGLTVRLLGITADQLEDRSVPEQMSLGDWSGVQQAAKRTEKNEKIQNIVEDLQKRFGEDHITKGPAKRE